MAAIFSKYVIVGLINTAVTVAVIFALTYMGLGIYTANALGYVVGICVSFLLNTYFTFSSKPTLSRLISWKLNSIKTVQFTAISMACNVDAVIKIEIDATGSLSKEIDLPKGKSVSVDVSPWDNMRSTLSIRKGKSSGCDSLTIKAL